MLENKQDSGPLGPGLDSPALNIKVNLPSGVQTSTQNTVSPTFHHYFVCLKGVFNKDIKDHDCILSAKKYCLCCDVDQSQISSHFITNL